MPIKTDDHIYFSGLNTLRFLAALAVIITHIELLKDGFGYKSYWNNPIIFNLGGLGVYFFFVLSGFLITYLLLTEKKRQGKIAIKKFYMRRILRIWPLYYLILIIGFFVLPQFDCFHISYLQKSFEKYFWENLILYILILPNLAFSIFSAVPNIGQVWSIGVEEQFYIMWPLVISKTKNVLKTLILIVLGLIVLKVCVLILGKFYSNTTWYEPFKLFIAMSKFECMAIGGIGAYFLFSNSNFIHIAYNKYIFIFSLAAIPALIFITPDTLQDGIHIIYSVLFLVIILNVSNNKMNNNLENKLFNYLGKISYGIYMYHFMIIPLVLYTFNKYLSINSEPILNILIYTASITITIAISSVSYIIFEKPFINLKSGFSIIKSGTT